MMFLGIDPDLNGGLAVVDHQTGKIDLLNRMPVYLPPTGGKRAIDVQLLFECVQQARRVGAQYAVLEKAVVKPQISSKGPAMMGSVHTVHQTYGAIRAVCEILFTRSRVIDAWPSTWKKDMGLTSDKSLSLQKALEYHPTHKTLFSKKKNTGMAEAVLLARWGSTKVIVSALEG